MDTLNLTSFIFLVVLFVLTPRGALRTARQLRAAVAEGKPVPRTRIVVSTMFAMTVLYLLSWINAQAMLRNLFAIPPLGAREIGIGILGFAATLLAIPAARYGRSPEEERRRLVHGIAPRTPREYATFCLLGVMAAIAEEAAYRGVAVWILTPIFGSMLPAIFLSAMAFAVAHAVQGGRTMAVIFAVALVFHLVTYLTGTLVIAMIIHALYDCVAGAIAGRRARELAGAPASGVTS